VRLLAEWLQAMLVRDEAAVEAVRQWHTTANPGPLLLLPVEPGPAHPVHREELTLGLEVAEPAGAWVRALLAGSRSEDGVGHVIRRANGAVYLPGAEATGPLSRRAELDELVRQLDDADRRLTELTQATEHAAEAHARAEHALETATEKHGRARTALREARGAGDDASRRLLRAERERVEADQPPRRRPFLRLAFVGVFVLIPTVIGLLFAYSVLAIPLPNQMVHQPSIGYEQGPRLAAPANAVPVQGPVLIDGQPASEPVSTTPNSLQRGRILFEINCAMCHGQDGSGKGRLSGYFSPSPANLTSEEVQALSDGQIFLVITQGWGIMPSLAENLSPVERWDVVNHVRSLRE